MICSIMENVLFYTVFITQAIILSKASNKNIDLF